MNVKEMKWTREPLSYAVCEDRIEITTIPYTDLWQRTYYHFRRITGIPIGLPQLFRRM